MLISDLILTAALVLAVAAHWWQPLRRARPALLGVAAVAGMLSLWQGMWQAVPALVLVAVLAAVPPLARRLRTSGPRPARLGAVAALLTLPAVAAPYYLSPLFDLPAPDGPHKVGTAGFELVDPARLGVMEDPPNRPRRIQVRVWYPADVPVGSRPRPYLSAQEVRDVAPALARNFEWPGFMFGHLGHVGTHSFEGVPVMAGGDPLPVLIFNHGYWCWPGQNSVLMEALASHGYIVFSIGHPYDAVALRFADGLVIPPSPMKAEASVPTPGMLAFWEAKDIAGRAAALPGYMADFDRHRVMRSFNAWRADTRFLMDSLRAGAVPPVVRAIAGRGDLNRIGQLGMSFGGTVAAATCHHDPGCPAAINMDGEEFDWTLYNAPVRMPLLEIHDDWVRYGHGDARYALNDFVYEPWAVAGTTPSVTRLRIEGVRHIGLLDLPLSARRPLRDRYYGAQDGRVATMTVAALSLAFFDNVMRNAGQGLPPGILDRYPAARPHSAGAVRDWFLSTPAGRAP